MLLPICNLFMWNLLVDTHQLSIMLSLMRTVTEAETVFSLQLKQQLLLLRHHIKNELCLFHHQHLQM